MCDDIVQMPVFSLIDDLLVGGMSVAVKEFAASLHLDGVGIMPILPDPINLKEGLTSIVMPFFDKQHQVEFNKLAAKVFSTITKRDVFWPSDGLADLTEKLITTLPKTGLQVCMASFV